MGCFWLGWILGLFRPTFVMVLWFLRVRLAVFIVCIADLVWYGGFPVCWGCLMVFAGDSGAAQFHFLRWSGLLSPVFDRTVGGEIWAVCCFLGWVLGPTALLLIPASCSRGIHCCFWFSNSLDFANGSADWAHTIFKFECYWSYALVGLLPYECWLPCGPGFKWWALARLTFFGWAIVPNKNCIYGLFGSDLNPSLGMYCFYDRLGFCFLDLARGF